MCFKLRHYCKCPEKCKAKSRQIIKKRILTIEPLAVRIVLRDGTLFGVVKSHFDAQNNITPGEWAPLFNAVYFHFCNCIITNNYNGNNIKFYIAFRPRNSSNCLIFTWGSGQRMGSFLRCLSPGSSVNSPNEHSVLSRESPYLSITSQSAMSARIVPFWKDHGILATVKASKPSVYGRNFV